MITPLRRVTPGSGFDFVDVPIELALCVGICTVWRRSTSATQEEAFISFNVAAVEQLRGSMPASDNFNTNSHP